MVGFLRQAAEGECKAHKKAPEPYPTPAAGVNSPHSQSRTQQTSSDGITKHNASLGALGLHGKNAALHYCSAWHHAAGKPEKIVVGKSGGPRGVRTPDQAIMSRLL